MRKQEKKRGKRRNRFKTGIPLIFGFYWYQKEKWDLKEYLMKIENRSIRMILIENRLKSTLKTGIPRRIMQPSAGDTPTEWRKAQTTERDERSESERKSRREWDAAREGTWSADEHAPPNRARESEGSAAGLDEENRDGIRRSDREGASE